MLRPRVLVGCFLGMLGLLLFGSTAGAEEKFDVIAFSPPAGWARDAAPDGAVLRFTKEDQAKGAFALITLYRAVAAGPDAKANFATAWTELARKPLAASEAQMGPTRANNGWEIETGSALFKQDRLSGVVLLVTASAEDKMANALLVTNSTAFQAELGGFVASLQFAPFEKGSAPAPAAVSVAKPEVWYAYRAAPGSFAYRFMFMAVLPSGDVLGSIPSEGMLGVSRATRPQYRWGRRKVSGPEVQFDYGEFGLTRMEPVADGKMSYPPGSRSSFYYRLQPVDGLRLAGEFGSASPDWHQQGKPADIVFRADGTFVNHAVTTEIRDESGRLLGTRDQGSGTYEIRDFTIIFKYSDGTLARRAFYLSSDEHGPLPDAILMGDYPHYRRRD